MDVELDCAQYLEHYGLSFVINAVARTGAFTLARIFDVDCGFLRVAGEVKVVH